MGLDMWLRLRHRTDFDKSFGTFDNAHGSHWQCKEKIYDVPMGNSEHTWRWARPPAPVRLTLVNGVPTFADGKATGERPGNYVTTGA